MDYLAENDSPEEVEERRANIDELISKAATYEDGEETPTLSGFLEEVALVADIDNMDDNNNVVSLMTLHSAKGLEFPIVYLAGMEDGLFRVICVLIQMILLNLRKKEDCAMWELRELSRNSS